MGVILGFRYDAKADDGWKRPVETGVIVQEFYSLDNSSSADINYAGKY